MPIVHSRLHEYRLTGNIADFLNNIQAKLQALPPETDGSRKCRIDELYGFMPPLDTVWFSVETDNVEYKELIRFYQLNGILDLLTEWDQLSIGIGYAQGEYYCFFLNVFKRSHKLLFSQQWDAQTYAPMVQLANIYLELLAAGFRSILLRIPAIRDDLRRSLEQIDDPLFRDCALEIFIHLLDHELSDAEVPELDLFLQRARILLVDVLARRAGLAAKAEYCVKHSRAAVRSSDDAWNLLHNPISLIWGHLASFLCYRRKIRQTTSRCFAFEEHFFPDGSISLGEVYSVESGMGSDMDSKIRYDRYREVFPDYETAIASRKIAQELIHKIHGEQR